MPSHPPTWYHARGGRTEPRPPLREHVDTAIAIVGGGLAGLASALSLAERGQPSVLLEGSTLGFGASGRNGGMASAGLTRPYSGLVRRFGVQRADRMFRESLEAVRLLRRRISGYDIACDPVDGVFEASWFDEPGSLEAYAAEMNRRFGMRLAYWPRARVREIYRTRRYHDGILDPEGLHFDPLALCRGYAAAAERQGVRIFEGTSVLSCTRVGERVELRCAEGSVRADRVILCPNVYGHPFCRRVDRGLLPVVSYVIVTAPLGERLSSVIRAPYAVFDDRMATGYYRPVSEGRLLWGGRVALFERRSGIERLMRRDLAQVYPELADVPVDFAWSGRMGFARHKLPVIGRIEPAIWVAAGFGGHGLNTTTMAGELVARGILDRDEGWRDFADYDLPWVGDGLGRLLAQGYYWAFALRDAVRARLPRFP